MKKKNGFTLVELLATIAILGLLATIAGISVSSILKKSKGDINTIQESMIMEAAKSYVLEHRSECKNGCILDSNKLKDYIDGDVTIDNILVLKDGNKYIYNNINIASNEVINSGTINEAGLKKLGEIYMKNKSFKYTKSLPRSDSGKYACCVSLKNIYPAYTGEFRSIYYYYNYDPKGSIGTTYSTMSLNLNNDCPDWPCEKYIN